MNKLEQTARELRENDRRRNVGPVRTGGEDPGTGEISGAIVVADLPKLMTDVKPHTYPGSSGRIYTENIHTWAYPTQTMETRKQRENPGRARGTKILSVWRSGDEN